MTREESINQILTQYQAPKYRTEQLYSAIYRSPLQKFSDIHTLPKTLISPLIETLGDDILTLKKISEIKGKQAHKVLFVTKDGHQIESVRLTYHLKTGIHHSLCISTQSGCALGCTFCATGAIGFKKNLTSDEIVDQVLYFIKNDLPVDTIIFMGMGEPFSNPNNTFGAVSILTDPAKMAIADRRLSISTVGIIPGIEHLTKHFPQVNLAFSLHSPFTEQRRQLMPVTNAYPPEAVFAALDEHLKVTNHKVFIAYLLLKDVNDSPDHAQALADLVSANPLRRKLLHVNLIRFNPADSRATFQRSPANAVERFKKILDDAGVHNTLRRDFGTEINAACGQLAAEYHKKTETVS